MASGELPFVVILGDNARGLETPRGGWTSDARHRWPVELGLWVGDCTLDGLRLVAPGDRAPTKVEVFAAPGNDATTPGDPLDDAFLSKTADDVVTDEKRKKWLSEYCAAVFTRCGSVTFGENNLGRKGSDMKERKVARLARSAKRTKFVRLVVHEPVRAPLPGDRNGDGSRVGFARIALLGKSIENRMTPVVSKIRWDAAEEELVKSGVSTDVVKSLALLRLSHRTTSVESDNDDEAETAKTIQQARQGELDAAAETGRAEDDGDAWSPGESRRLREAARRELPLHSDGLLLRDLPGHPWPQSEGEDVVLHGPSRPYALVH